MKFARLLLLSLLPVSLAACPIPEGDGLDGPREVETDRTCDNGCVSTNARCQGVADEEDGLRCAECDGTGRICGTPETARCVERVNAYGDACQTCRTDDGTVVYDDCAVAGDVTADHCEPVEDANREGDNCEVCFDADGTPVSTSCTPAFDRCEEVTRSDGLTCQECFLGDEFAFVSCDPVDVEPSQCVAYGDDQGSCVECFDDSGMMVFQSCSPQQGGGAVCESFISVDGLACQVCTDSFGTLTDVSCEDEPPPTFCEVLRFTEQTCTICIGEQGQLLHSACARNDCEDANGSCPPPPPCTTTVGSDGTICRSCPLEQAPDVVEVQCVGDGDQGLVCTVENMNFAAPDPGGDPAPPEEQCLVCRADGVEVYTRCESEGPLEPPVCADQAGADGQACTTCYAPDTDERVYSDCMNEECFPYAGPDGQDCLRCIDIATGDVLSDTCDDTQTGTCYETPFAPVVGPDGQPAIIESPDGDAFEASADCVTCFDNGNTPSSSSCLLRVTCDGMSLDPNQPGLIAPPPCNEEIVLFYDVARCNNPWGATPPNEQRTLALMNWLIDQGALPFFVDVLVDNPGDDCTACPCLTGERAEVRVPAEDIDILLNLGFY